MKRREAKSKGEKERYNHLNAEFQEKEMQKVKVVVEEALQIAEKRREAEGK